MLDDTTQLWFPVPDLLDLTVHCVQAASLDPDPQFGTTPVLRLMAQGR